MKIKKHFHLSSGNVQVANRNAGLCAPHSTSGLFSIPLKISPQTSLEDNGNVSFSTRSKQRMLKYCKRMAKDSCKTWVIRPRGNDGPGGERRGAPDEAPLVLAESKALERAAFSILSLIFVVDILCFFICSPAWAMAKKPPEPKDPAVEIHEKLPPLTLQDCFQLASKRSETLAIHQQEIVIAEAQLFKAASEGLGDIDFVMTDFRQDAPKPNSQSGSSSSSGSSGGSDSSFGSSFNAEERRERKFTITQPLFQGFKSVGALSGAGSFKKQRKEESLRAGQILFLEVSQAFYNVIQYKKDIEIIKGIEASLNERVDDLKEREKIGRSRISEVVDAKSKLRVLEADLAHANGALKIALHLLEFFVGIPIEAERLAEEKLDTPTVNSNLNELIKATEIRPDVKAAEQTVKTARSGVVVAQSDLWPVISLENNDYIHREGSQRNDDWDLLLKFDVPLFRGGGTVGKIKESISEWKKANLSYSLTKRQAELEIKEAYEDWVASVDQSKALELAVKEAEENYNLQKEDYARSLVNNLDVLAALESLARTRRDANQTYYQMRQNYWRLKVSLGEVL